MDTITYGGAVGGGKTAKLRSALDTDAMGERGRHMPPAPRLVLRSERGWRVGTVAWRWGGTTHVKTLTLLPLVDKDWLPVQDKWVLPGGKVLTYVEVCSLAVTNGWEVNVIN